MLFNQSDEITIAIIAGTVTFLLFAIFIIAYLLIYRKKRMGHNEEMQKARLFFQQEILKSQLEIQEQTFTHISQEIHDNVGQVLSLAKVQINIMNESEQMSKPMLDEVKQNIGKAMTDLRDIARSLSSERIKNLSITDSVKNEAIRINKTGLMQVTVTNEGEEKNMNHQKKLILFRIVQECLQNIIKHADASEVLIHFHYNEKLQTTIKDNGKGFNTAAALQASNGLGLSNIQTRATLAGGHSVIESVPSQGSTIIINMPYE